MGGSLDFMGIALSIRRRQVRLYKIKHASFFNDSVHDFYVRLPHQLIYVYFFFGDSVHMIKFPPFVDIALMSLGSSMLHDITSY